MIESGASDDGFPNMNWLWTVVLVAALLVVALIVAKGVIEHGGVL